jgi:Na+:H+ antiporter, NhaA family
MSAITKLFKDFTNSERSGGFVLIGITIISLLLANSIIGPTLTHLYHTKLGFSNSVINLNLSVEHWINDGLMTIFFLLVGLEIEREIYIGELSTRASAALPAIAALGGMVAPFLIHYALNNGLPTQNGGGIPMATDIAFALGILSLAKRVPFALKIFLTAFAIIDDLGAILVIAFFYTDSLRTDYLLAALVVMLLLFLFNRLKVYKIWLYVVFGIVLWYCMLQSGVHATLSGVLLAFAMPFGKGDAGSLSYKVQHRLHKPVAFIIIPLFALVNTGIVIPDNWFSGLGDPNSMGIIAGLVIGKPVGIVLFCFLAIKLGLSKLPPGISWAQLTAAGILGGIGFTMSIFITLLAFSDVTHITESKIAILVASFIASILGLLLLKLIRRFKVHGQRTITRR